VAFVGAFRAPGDLNPWLAAVLAALLTTWVTFVPCFLFVLLGAPHVERLRNNESLAAALSGITAAVVGVIASLGLFFAVHTLFARSFNATWGPLSVQVPEPASVQVPALAVTVLACVLIFAARWSVLRTLGVCAVSGVLVQLVLTM
jgi:chromate transporter